MIRWRNLLKNPFKICHICGKLMVVWFQEHWWSYEGYSHYWCTLRTDKNE